MTEPLTPEQAREWAEQFGPGGRAIVMGLKSECPVVKWEIVLKATLRAYADQADALTRLSAYEKAVGEYFAQADEHARAMTAAIEAYHRDEFEGETKKAREASGKMNAAEARLRALQEKK